MGFLKDEKRMNVAITRAKHCLWIIGNSYSLNKTEHWRALINHIREEE
jgi:superfamily I DNA and/or RNA helicase